MHREPLALQDTVSVANELTRRQNAEWSHTTLTSHRGVSPTFKSFIFQLLSKILNLVLLHLPLQRRLGNKNCFSAAVKRGTRKAIEDVFFGQPREAFVSALSTSLYADGSAANRNKTLILVRRRYYGVRKDGNHWGAPFHVNGSRARARAPR
ncbi:hypothetical protein L596_003349 [Steinernema carpocapsae]|uniref:Uncharacterized protein n=1 Tax=Steinernema carpocapsae TaxID=34508 RepID=A0A4U8UTA0_STECR|nr:hypothetical protein L596_003349 [Steinernema carpocapsae]